MSNLLKFMEFVAKATKENPEDMIPDAFETDGDGKQIAFKMIAGTRMGCFPGLKQRFAELPDLPIRDDDVLIPAFPKSGTHWLWEVCSMIRRKKAASTNSTKLEGFIEFLPQEILASYPSPRVINTHVLPDQLPKQVLEKKLKLIMVLRNPKDVTVSFCYHTKTIPHYGYADGTFKGYFEVFINEKNDYGSWFDYTLAWDKFLQTYPKDRQLILYYEDVKEDLPKYVRLIAKYLGVELDDALADAIAEQCGFKNMKESIKKMTAKFRPPPGRPGMPEDAPKGGVKLEMPDLLRKGIVGDWKSEFTVAQSERFDAKYKAKMGDCSFKFRYEL